MRRNQAGSLFALTNGNVRRRRFLTGLAATALACASLPLVARIGNAQLAISFTVNSIGDSPDAFLDGNCSESSGVGACTLRAAIDEVNGFSGSYVINFNIPGSGVQTIALGSPLPPITHPVTINGYSQPGSAPNTALTGNNAALLIEVPGEINLSGTTGSVIKGLVISGPLRINVGGSNTVEGNFIGTNATGTAVNPAGSGGIAINGSSNNTIGGTLNVPSNRNLISGNGNGINLFSGSNGNTIANNYIGTNSQGTAAIPNGTGVALTNGSNNQILGNLISGNTYGIAAEGNAPGESLLTIFRNFIGTDAAGTSAIPNTRPILVGSLSGTISQLQIGGGSPALRNIISGNNGAGIELFGNVTNALIRDNYIGVGIDGTTALGNARGILLGSNSAVNGTQIGGTPPADANIIANNTSNGVAIQNGTGNQVLRNSMYNNGGAGILLGSGPANDALDADGGPNQQQNSPVITSAALSATELTVNYNLDTDTANGSYPMRIEVFKADEPGTGEGLEFLGFASIAGPGSGSVVIPTPVSVVGGDPITATATQADGDTSPFSATFAVTGAAGSGLVVNSLLDDPDANAGDGTCLTSAGECTLRAAMQQANSNAGPDTITFSVAGTITAGSVLFATGDLTIDGTTAPGANCNQWPPVPTVTVRNQVTQNLINASGGAFVMKGLVLNGGAVGASQTDGMVRLDGNGGRLECNFFGTNATGTGFGTDSAVPLLLVGSGNTAGGPLPTQRNLFFGTANTQMSVIGNNNVVEGNYIGTNVNGGTNFTGSTSISLAEGIFVFGSNNQVRGNTIKTLSVAISETGGTGSTISNNILGGTLFSSGTGIVMTNSAGGATISNNTISGYPTAGVNIRGTSTGNSIRSNSITGISSGLGIDLATTNTDGVTFNHTGPLAGANDFQNYPVLDSVTSTATPVAQTTVVGRVDGIANREYEIDVFSNNSCDPTGFGEGETFLGTIPATADANGVAKFNETLPAGLGEPFGVTATATDLTTGSTSEFSYCYAASTPNTSWATAQPVGSGSSTSQFITSRLQEKWFKVPVSAQAKVKVVLSGLPGAAVSLHRDPTSIYNGLTNPSSAVALSAEAADFAFLPSGSLPSGSLPSGSLPSGSLPSGSLPSGSLPSGYLPSGSLPSGSLPSGSLPSGSLPSGSLPSGSLPSGSLPSGSLPSGSLPSGSLPSGSLPSGSLPSGSLPSGSLPSGSLPSGSLDAYSTAARKSLLGVSMTPYAAVQTIERNTFDIQEDLYIRVVGPYSLSSPFNIAVTVEGGVCSGPNALLPIAGPVFTAPAGTGRQTIILTDSAHMKGTSTEVAAAMAKLATLAANTDVNGVVVDLAGFTRVQNARTQALAKAACPSAANVWAAEIKAVVDAYRSTNPGLQYVVLAGGRDVIPFHQVSDVAGLASEKDYVPPVDPNSPSEAGLRSGLVSGQDYYGSAVTLNISGRSLAVPDLAVGRLVESAGDISAAVDAYIATGGVVNPASSLVTGYDFVGDAARQVSTEVAAVASVDPNATLIQDPGGLPAAGWTADQLRSKLLPAGDGADLLLLSGHFSAGSLLAADYKTTLTAAEVATSATNLVDSVIVALGCHGGYTLPTTDLLTGASPDPDWAKAFLRKGAAGYIAATGYAYGDTELTEYGERLVVGLAQQMRTGPGAIPLGKALVAAKKAYLSATAQMTGIDEKTLVEMTLYGLPMMKIDMPGPRLPGAVTPPLSMSNNTIATGTPGANNGLSSTAAVLSPAITPVTKVLPNLATGGNVTTKYYTGRDGVVANPYEPILPKQIDSASAAGKVLRGVAFRGGTYTDEVLTPLTASPNTETSGPHQSFNTEVFYPNQLFAPNFTDTLTGGSTKLVTFPAQFRSSAPGANDGTLRKFNNLNLNFYYLPDSWTAPSASASVKAAAVSPAPSILGASAAVIPNTTNVKFNVNVQNDGSAGVQSVWVLYTGTTAPYLGTWTPLDLTRDLTNADPTMWQGTLNIGTADPASIRFIVQAVNGAGLTALATNFGAFYTVSGTVLANGIIPQPAPPAASSITLAQPASVPYLSQVTLSATVSPAVSGRVVDFDLGGQAKSGTTNSSGQVTVTLSPVIAPGTYTAQASVRGDASYATASNSKTLSISKASSTLTISPASSSFTTGQPSGISATLKSGSAGLGGKSIVFVVRDSGGTTTLTKTVIADVYGEAALGAISLPAGTYSVQAYFASGPLPINDENYLGSQSSTSSITVAGLAAPTITASAKNADGSSYTADTWTKQNVTVQFTCNVSNCTTDQVVSAEGTTGPITGTATAPSGQTATATFGPIKIDKTVPTLTITTPASAASYAAGSTVLASFSCADARSGIATCVGTVPNGSGIDTATAGAKSFTVTATDQAGNVTTQTVSYTVTGTTSGAPVVTADLGVSGLQEIGFQSNIVFVSGSFTAGGGAPYRASVRWSTGGTFSTFVLNSNSQFLAPFVYSGPSGTYNVTVRICDKNGTCGTDDVVVRANVTQRVTPIRECVVDRGASVNPRYLARFGYSNPATFPIYVATLPLIDNTFTTLPVLRGQPQVFAPGTQSNVFTATFNSGSIAWRLNNITVSAASSSPRC